MFHVGFWNEKIKPVGFAPFIFESYVKCLLFDFISGGLGFKLKDFLSRFGSSPRQAEFVNSRFLIILASKRASERASEHVKNTMYL